MFHLKGNSMIQVSRKVLSTGLSTVLVSINGTEGMTLPEVVRVFGIPEQTISSHMKTSGLGFSRISGKTTAELRNHGVIPLTGRPPRIVPKAAIESLVRFISTPETDTINSELWTTAEAVHKGDINAARAIVGVTEDDVLNHLETALQLARKFKTERDTANKRAYLAMGKASVAVKLNRGLDKELADKGTEVITLKERLGEATDWKHAIGWKGEFPSLATYSDSQLGKVLKAVSEELGLEVRKAPHGKYGQVGVYHRSAVEKLV
jgi:hypothetical protein